LLAMQVPGFLGLFLPLYQARPGNLDHVGWMAVCLQQMAWAAAKAATREVWADAPSGTPTMQCNVSGLVVSALAYHGTAATQGGPTRLHAALQPYELPAALC
jgi:hypothetical protein